MSDAPAFRLILFVHDGQIQAYSLEKKQWVVSPTPLLLDKPVPAEFAKSFTGENILILLSDSAAGHLQMTLPNKKEQLTDENIGAVLQKDFDIDTRSYEFALQKFLVGRDTVQVSVTGVEKEIYTALSRWIAPFEPKKTWLIPFAWFLSVLKSVEPALMAVASEKDQLLVSHHYLGIDDARQISLSEIAAYANDRKKERKDTHILYVQAVPKVVSQIQKQLGESLTAQALLPEATDAPMLDVIQAVMAKGLDSVGDVLHFVLEPEQAAVVPDAEPAEVEEVEEVVLTVSAEPALVSDKQEEAPELLPPSPDPGFGASLPAPLAPPAPPAPVVVPVEEEKGETESVEVTARPVKLESAPLKLAEPEPEEAESAPEPVPDLAQTVAPKEDLLSQLKSAKVVSDNRDRYVQVEKRSHWKMFAAITLAVALITGIVGGAIFWSQQITFPSVLRSTPVPTPTPTPESTPEPTPEPTPTPTVSNEQKAETKILILNATGIPGLAGKEKEVLEAQGWSDIRTGNATGTYADAIFASSKDSELLKALEADYGQTLRPVTELKEANVAQYDVVIVIGQEVSR